VRALLTTIGSRGDVQPLVALATRLRESGHQACLCVPPDLRDWIEGLGFPVTPLGIGQRGTGVVDWPPRQLRSSPEQLRELVTAAVADEFTTIAAAAAGCDVILAAAGRRPIAARSVAEALGIHYIFAAFSPLHLPSLELPADRFNDTFGPPLNGHRVAAGLAPVRDVRGHIFTAAPWLAADPVLSGSAGRAGYDVVQAGAWILPDERPLGPELEAFLGAGEPPVYFGFGSMKMPPHLAQDLARAARQTGRRAIISAGWADLALTGRQPGCLVIGEVNHHTLFRQVAAVVHHGGAGTTTTAALAGVPQVIVPQFFDQGFWARRVGELGIGIAHEHGTPTADSLTAALRLALQPAVADRARSLSAVMTTGGAQAAAADLAALVMLPESDPSAQRGHSTRGGEVGPMTGATARSG
jgi:vancomycin aglycone glucosyltransferase